MKAKRKSVQKSDKKNPHAVVLGRRGGKKSSPAKIAAARRNALLGGRPRNKPTATVSTDKEGR